MTETDVVERKRAAEIPLHGPEAFEAMRRVGRLTAECLDMLTDYVKPGVTTEFLDKLAFDFIRDHGAYPACLHYRGYTKTICTSINHVVCHGIPNDKPLRDGRHHEHRRHPHPRRVARGFEPDVLCGRGAAPGRSACARSPMNA